MARRCRPHVTDPLGPGGSVSWSLVRQGLNGLDDVRGDLLRKVCRGVDERGSRRGAQQLGDHFESSIQFAVHDVRWNVELVG